MNHAELDEWSSDYKIPKIFDPKNLGIKIILGHKIFFNIKISRTRNFPDQTICFLLADFGYPNLSFFLPKDCWNPEILF